MNKIGQFVSKDFFGFIQLTAFPFFHCFNFLNRHKGQKFQTIDNIIISYISPILEKFIRWSFFGIKPQSTLFGFSHFFAFLCSQQSKGHAVYGVLFYSSYQIHSVDNIGPLIISAQFNFTAELII